MNPHDSPSSQAILEVSWNTPHEVIDVDRVTEAIISLENMADTHGGEAMKGEILEGLSKLPGVTWAKFTKDAEILFLAYGKTSKENRENLAKKLWFHPHVLTKEA